MTTRHIQVYTGEHSSRDLLRGSPLTPFVSFRSVPFTRSLVPFRFGSVQLLIWWQLSAVSRIADAGNAVGARIDKSQVTLESRECVYSIFNALHCTAQDYAALSQLQSPAATAADGPAAALAGASGAGSSSSSNKKTVRFAEVHQTTYIGVQMYFYLSLYILYIYVCVALTRLASPHSSRSSTLQFIRVQYSTVQTPLGFECTALRTVRCVSSGRGDRRALTLAVLLYSPLLCTLLVYSTPLHSTAPQLHAIRFISR